MYVHLLYCYKNKEEIAMKKIISLLLAMTLVVACTLVGHAVSVTELQEAFDSSVIPTEYYIIDEQNTLDSGVASFRYHISEDSPVQQVRDGMQHEDILCGDYDVEYWSFQSVRLYLDGKLYGIPDAYDENVIDNDDLKELASLYPDVIVWGSRADYQAQFTDWIKTHDSDAKYFDHYRKLFEKTDADDTAQWALIRSYCYDLGDWDQMFGYETNGVVIPGEMGAVNIEQAFPYYIYDIKDNAFYSITAVELSDYEGLLDVLTKAGIARPIGDCDGDGLLDIIDATHLQRALAELCELDVETDSYWCGGIDGSMKRYSDMDGDSEVTILDATRIQRKLAGLD